jgi:CO/xanthine dehydrogenase Mo-binding subunit
LVNAVFAASGTRVRGLPVRAKVGKEALPA